METNLLKLAEKYGLRLRQIGRGKYQCSCPYPDHHDSTPSFTIYVESNSFFCFGCRRSGGYRAFLSLMDPAALAEMSMDIEMLEDSIRKIAQPDFRDHTMIQAAVMFHVAMQAKSAAVIFPIMQMFDEAMANYVVVPCDLSLELLRRLRVALDESK